MRHRKKIFFKLRKHQVFFKSEPGHRVSVLRNCRVAVRTASEHLATPLHHSRSQSCLCNASSHSSLLKSWQYRNSPLCIKPGSQDQHSGTYPGYTVGWPTNHIPFTLRTTLISLHLCLFFQVVLFLQSFLLKFSMNFLYLPCMLRAHPTKPP
jgi:hypothetical protein